MDSVSFEIPDKYKKMIIKDDHVNKKFNDLINKIQYT